jgi:putative spermidine/putrescine transport system permease protein
MILLGNSGVLNTMFKGLGFGSIQLLYNKLGVGIAFVHFMVPFCVLTLVGALQTIPSNLVEAATSLGASRIRSFWSVVFPLSVPGLVGATLLTFALASSAFLFPLLLGGGKVRLMSNHIYEIIFTTFNFSDAAVAAIVLLVATFGIVAVIPWAIRKGMTVLEVRAT